MLWRVKNRYGYFNPLKHTILQYRQIKVGGVYHIKDIYGDIIRVKVTEKRKSEIYFYVFFDYMDGNAYFGAKQGVSYSETSEISKILC